MNSKFKSLKSNPLILFILSVLIFSFANCKKDKPTYYMPQEFKDFILYSEGSYWIYEDSITGNTDSIYLSNYNINIAEPSHFDYKYEKLEQNFYSSFSIESQYRAETWLLQLEDPSLYEYTGYGYYGGNKDANIEYISNFDSLNIKGVWYKDVKCIYNYDGNITYYYWVKYIGIIKKEDKFNNQNWQLIKYHINQ